MHGLALVGILVALMAAPALAGMEDDPNFLKNMKKKYNNNDPDPELGDRSKAHPLGVDCRAYDGDGKGCTAVMVRPRCPSWPRCPREPMCEYDYSTKPGGQKCHWKCQHIPAAADAKLPMGVTKGGKAECLAKGNVGNTDVGNTLLRGRYGCQWLDVALGDTSYSRQCTVDCSARANLAACYENVDCMWTGATCEKRCSLTDLVGDPGLAHKDYCGDPHLGSHPSCKWQIKPPRDADGKVGKGKWVESCEQPCEVRGDSNTCNPPREGGLMCVWDNCDLKCKKSQKTHAPWDPAFKKAKQLKAKCSDRHAASAVYNYQCANPASHCYVDDGNDVVPKRHPIQGTWRCIKKGTGGYPPYKDLCTVQGPQGPRAPWVGGPSGSCDANNIAEKTCDGWLKFWPAHDTVFGEFPDGPKYEDAPNMVKAKEKCLADGCMWVNPQTAMSGQFDGKWVYQYDGPKFIDAVWTKSNGDDGRPWRGGVQMCGGGGIGHPHNKCCNDGLGNDLECDWRLPTPGGATTAAGGVGGPNWMCAPDCLALNKLSRDPAYAKAEPVFTAGSGTASMAKAQHFCELEDACRWKASDKGGAIKGEAEGECQWRDDCGAFCNTNSCDGPTCENARGGGGLSPVEMHGKCHEITGPSFAGSMIKTPQCLEKCEIRRDKKSCTAGGGAREKDTWTDSAGKTASCDMPIRIGDNGLIDGPNARLKIPKECMGMCRWDAAKAKCFSACEYRKTKAECGAPTSGCTWDSSGGYFGNKNNNAGVADHGFKKQSGIPCSGTPTAPLFSHDLSVLAKEAKARMDKMPEGKKGAGGMKGPVSGCILKAMLAGVTQAVAQPKCYKDVELKIDAAHQQPYEPPKVLAGKEVDYAKCKSFNLPPKTFELTLQIEVRNSDKGAKLTDKFPFKPKGGCVQVSKFTMSWGKVYKPGDARTDMNCNREGPSASGWKDQSCKKEANCVKDPSTKWVGASKPVSLGDVLIKGLTSSMNTFLAIHYKSGFGSTGADKFQICPCTKTAACKAKCGARVDTQVVEISEATNTRRFSWLGMPVACRGGVTKEVGPPPPPPPPPPSPCLWEGDNYCDIPDKFCQPGTDCADCAKTEYACKGGRQLSSGSPPAPSPSFSSLPTPTPTPTGRGRHLGSGSNSGSIVRCVDDQYDKTVCKAKPSDCPVSPSAPSGKGGTWNLVTAKLRLTLPKGTPPDVAQFIIGDSNTETNGMWSAVGNEGDADRTFAKSIDNLWAADMKEAFGSDWANWSTATRIAGWKHEGKKWPCGEAGCTAKVDPNACKKGETWSASGSAPCGPCAPRSTCQHGVTMDCTPKSNTKCNPKCGTKTCLQRAKVRKSSSDCGCVFPWVYAGIEYTSCITLNNGIIGSMDQNDSNAAWCALQIKSEYGIFGYGSHIQPDPSAMCADVCPGFLKTSGVNKRVKESKKKSIAIDAKISMPTAAFAGPAVLGFVGGVFLVGLVSVIRRATKPADASDADHEDAPNAAAVHDIEDIEAVQVAGQIEMSAETTAGQM